MFMHDKQVQEKITYAKWKATSIAKAFREGRVPTPGPANATPLPQGSPALSSSAHEDGGSGVFGQDGNHANSNDSSEDVSRQLLGTASNSSLRRPQGHVDNITDLSEDKDDDDEALNFSLPPAPGGEPSSVPSRPSLPSVPSSHTAPPPPITAYRPSAPPADESFSSVMGTSSQNNNAGSSGINTLPPSADDWHPLPSTIDPTAMAQAQKYAKFAISALNYEDVDTARRELQKALQLIGG
jgi:vacuolar protein sorting-associated protein VTA1